MDQGIWTGIRSEIVNQFSHSMLYCRSPHESYKKWQRYSFLKIRSNATIQPPSAFQLDIWHLWGIYRASLSAGLPDCPRRIYRAVPSSPSEISKIKDKNYPANIHELASGPRNLPCTLLLKEKDGASLKFECTAAEVCEVLTVMGQSQSVS